MLKIIYNRFFTPVLKYIASARIKTLFYTNIDKYYYKE